MAMEEKKEKDETLMQESRITMLTPMILVSVTVRHTYDGRVGTNVSTPELVMVLYT